MYFGNSFFHASVVWLVIWVEHGQVNADIEVKSDTNRTVQRYSDLPASPSFGKPFPRDGVWGHLLYTEPDDGCAPIHQPSNDSNWIAVMSMSENCKFDKQVRNAEDAGFMAAIVHNNENDVLIEMKNTSHRLGIPSTFIALSSSHMLSQFHNRTDASVLIVEYTTSDTEELLLIILAAVSSFSAVVVLGIVIGIGVHSCYRNRSQLLSRWKLKRLPVHIFKKGDLYENCAICLEEYNEGDKLRILPCAHAFHSKCIDVWLTKNRKTCPLCNETVNPSRRKQSRSDSERNRDDERRPLLMPVSNNDSSSDAENIAELSQNRSNVEIHEEPSPRSMNGSRSYGTVVPTDASAAFNISDPVEQDGDPLFSVEYVNMFGRSPLCHIKADPDLSEFLSDSELPAENSGGNDQEFVKSELEGIPEPKVYTSKHISPTRSPNDVV